MPAKTRCMWSKSEGARQTGCERLDRLLLYFSTWAQAQ